MITIKDKSGIEKMYSAGQLLAGIFMRLTSLIEPGITTFAIDSWIETEIKNAGLVSQMKGYMGSYHHVSCISINDEVVHGIPSKLKIINEGDLVKVDVCASWKGYCADLARCFYVGNMPDSVKNFIETTQRALNKGIEQARTGNRLSDISAAIQQEVEKDGYGVVRDFAGHGIGKKMHEDPEILNYGKPGQGPLIEMQLT